LTRADWFVAPAFGVVKLASGRAEPQADATAGAGEHSKRRVALVPDQYNHDVVIDTLRINGRQSLGEHIADIVGLELAYAATLVQSDVHTAVH